MMMMINMVGNALTNNISWRSGQAKILASHWAVYASVYLILYITYEYFVHNKANQQVVFSFSPSAVVDHGYHVHTCMHTSTHTHTYDMIHFVYIYMYQSQKTKHSPS